jgi:hypothetical protein
LPAGKVIPVILDSYGSPKHPKVLPRLARHPRWTFPLTPSSGSWLNGSRPMPRPPRLDHPEMVRHLLDRANARATIFARLGTRGMVPLFNDRETCSTGWRVAGDPARRHALAALTR